MPELPIETIMRTYWEVAFVARLGIRTVMRSAHDVSASSSAQAFFSRAEINEPFKVLR
jgi:hypothetical protein